jgi:hypothetical protein
MEKQNYEIDLAVKYGFRELIDVEAIARAASVGWSNQTLCQVNDCVVRLGIAEASSTGTSTTARTSSFRRQRPIADRFRGRPDRRFAAEPRLRRPARAGASDARAGADGHAHGGGRHGDADRRCMSR